MKKIISVSLGYIIVLVTFIGMLKNAQANPWAGDYLMTWEKPTTRTNGEPLLPGEVRGYDVWMSSEALDNTDKIIKVGDNVPTNEFSYTYELEANACFWVRTINHKGVRSADGPKACILDIDTKAPKAPGVLILIRVGG